MQVSVSIIAQVLMQPTRHVMQWCRSALSSATLFSPLSHGRDTVESVRSLRIRAGKHRRLQVGRKESPPTGYFLAVLLWSECCYSRKQYCRPPTVSSLSVRWKALSRKSPRLIATDMCLRPRHPFRSFSVLERIYCLILSCLYAA